MTRELDDGALWIFKIKDKDSKQTTNNMPFPSDYVCLFVPCNVKKGNNLSVGVSQKQVVNPYIIVHNMFVLYISKD